MTTLKCKICGGNIVLTGKSYGICDSCGSEVTLPIIDDDKRADMYNRGDYYRRIGDYDRAYSAFEHIIADDRNDAEAHWCLTLCRYGVEYVRDARTEEYKPTVSRMSYESILDDPDYLLALDASDEYTRGIYRKEAQKIYSIQKHYLEISRKEEPYDVFICFKAEDKNGQRTKASVIGQDIHEKLSEKGVKVFFSRITLESKLSEEYEPYIFAALHSAKVMLLVADKPEQLEARWVKNEWKRYLNMMDVDSNKQIIPVFVDMSPHDFPPEIPTVQGQDMSRVGAMQDLIRGVLKLTGRIEEKFVSTVVTTGNSGVTTKNIMVRVEQAIEDDDFDEADHLLEEILNREPENGEAYYYRFLVRHQQKRLSFGSDFLSEEEQNWCEDRNFQRALRYASGDRKKELETYQCVCNQSKVMFQVYHENKEGRYNKALELLDALEQEKYGPLSSSHMQQVQMQLEEIREKKKRLDECNAGMTYIQNTHTFLRRIMQEQYPKETQEYEELRSIANKKGINTDIKTQSKTSVHMALISILLCIATVICSILILNVESESMLLFTVIWVILLGTSGAMGEKESGWIWYLITAIYGLILYVIYTIIKIRLSFLLSSVIALLYDFHFLISTCKMRAYLKASKGMDLEDYYNVVLKPLEESMRDNVIKNWKGKVDSCWLELADYNGHFQCKSGKPLSAPWEEYRVEEIYVKVDDHVNKGDPLFKISQTEGNSKKELTVKSSLTGYVTELSIKKNAYMNKKTGNAVIWIIPECRLL